MCLSNEPPLDCSRITTVCINAFRAHHRALLNFFYCVEVFRFPITCEQCCRFASAIRPNLDNVSFCLQLNLLVRCLIGKHFWPLPLAFTATAARNKRSALVDIAKRERLATALIATVRKIGLLLDRKD